MSKIPSRGSDQFNLRFPEGLRDAIKTEAERNGRSMNAEIIQRLEMSLENIAPVGDLGSAFRAIMDKLTSLETPPSDDQLNELFVHYSSFREEEISALRNFMELATALWRDARGQTTGTFEEKSKREFERNFAAAQNWLDAWGYEIKKRPGQKGRETDDDPVHWEGIVSMKTILKNTRDKS